jgi:serine/threonine protein kinase
MSDDLVRMPKEGDVIAGKYRVEKILGSGGMGSVYSARHQTTNRVFALKLMASSLSGDPEAKERFIREARLAGSIDHPGVVDIYDVGYHDVSLYMVMDLLRGESLGARLKRGPLPPAEAVHLMRGVLRGVAAAHAKGIVHRDLKPDNIFLHREAGSQQIEPKILDFGVSKSLVAGTGLPALTQTGAMLGTPIYMSPEQVHGSKYVDRRTDIYSLGVILYQMLSGQVPYKADNFATLVFEIVNGKPRRLESLVPDLPEGLSAVVMRSMAVSADDRYPDAESMAAALGAFDSLAVPAVRSASGRPVAQETQPLGSAPPPASALPAETPSPSGDTATPFITEAVPKLPVRRAPVVLALGAVAVVAAGAAAAFLGLRGDRDTSTPGQDGTVLQTQASATPPGPPGVIATAAGPDGGIAGRSENTDDIPRGIEAPHAPVGFSGPASRAVDSERSNRREDEPARAEPGSTEGRSGAADEEKQSERPKKKQEYRIEEDGIIDPF